MNAGVRKSLISFTILALFWTADARPAVANSIPTKSDANWIALGVAAIGAAIGIGVYLAVRPHSRGITGCASSGLNGLQLVSEGDQQIYALVGDTAGITSGERVRVSGKREKKSDGASRQFLVEKLNKTYGSCAVTSGAR
jgi:hypothetical protein